MHKNFILQKVLPFIGILIFTTIAIGMLIIGVILIYHECYLIGVGMLITVVLFFVMPILTELKIYYHKIKSYRK